MSHTLSHAGLDLIKSFEGCAKRRRDGRFDAYPDPGSGGDPWTIGWGATGAGISKGTVWSQEHYDARLAQDVAVREAMVNRALGDTPTTQGQFDALVSFQYNTGKLMASTLLRRHRAGDYDAAVREFGRWVNAAGKPMAGLIRRRAAEAQLYKTG